MSAKPFLCGPKDGLPVDILTDVGAGGVRFTADPNYSSQPHYLQQVSEFMLDALVTFDRDSFPMVDWDAVRRGPHLLDWQAPVMEQLEWYTREWVVRPHIIHIWNEWHGTGGDEESPMPASVINDLAHLTRLCFGHSQLIAHGSIVDGQPSSLQELDWTYVDFAAMDEYTKTAPGHENEPPGGDVLNLAQYRAVLPKRIRMIIPEIGLSSWEAGEDAQAAYVESIMTHAISLDDLYLVGWFSGHNHGGFGLIRNDGTLKPAYAAYQRAAVTYQPDEPEPEEPAVAKYPEPALARYWQSIDPSIPFDISPAPAGLGICRHWAEDPYKYGPPTGDEAADGDGRSIQLFAKRPIRWTPQGAEDVEP